MRTTANRCKPGTILGHGDCACWWALCDCGHAREYPNEATARRRATEHEGGHMAEDAELERWIDRTMDSVDWHEERAEALGWEGTMGYDVPRVTEAERREALGIAAALEVAEDAPEDEPGIVYSWTEPCMCGEVHPV